MKLSRLIFGVVAIWFVTAMLVWLFAPDWQTRGQFGDMFGAVNALFSGLAFAGLYSALRLQHDQLELQRKELALQREELKLQREEMASTREELANQVAAQKALVRATGAQITVAAAQAKIESIKMRAENTQGHARSQHIEEIERLADTLSDISARIETSV